MKFQVVLWFIISCIIAFIIGYDRGSQHQKLILEKSNLELIESQHRKYNKVLIQRESQIIDLTNKNIKLLEQVKHNAEIINNTNRITNRFVHYSSTDSMSKATTATTESTETSDDDATVVKATRVIQYNILLMHEFNQCRINYNALIDSIK